MSLKILLAEDQNLIRTSLVMLLEEGNEFEVIATAGNGREALTLGLELDPDLVLLDVRMPELSGLQVARQIKLEKPELPVVLLTTFEDDEVCKSAVSIGVNGYLIKDIDPDLFRSTLKCVYNGLLVFHPSIKRCLKDGAVSPGDSLAKSFNEDLTEKDIVIIRHVAMGLSNKEIASLMHSTEGTVKNRVSSILSKMGLQARTQIAVYAVKKGLI